MHYLIILTSYRARHGPTPECLSLVAGQGLLAGCYVWREPVRFAMQPPMIRHNEWGKSGPGPNNLHGPHPTARARHGPTPECLSLVARRAPLAGCYAWRGPVRFAMQPPMAQHNECGKSGLGPNNLHGPHPTARARHGPTPGCLSLVARHALLAACYV